MIEHFITEHAAIRNAEEEKHFFERKIEEFDASEVVFIESPNTLSCKKTIPDQKENSWNKECREEGFPLFIELQLILERERQWHGNRAEVYEEIGVVQKLLVVRC
jgi:hypothetical protein